MFLQNPAENQNHVVDVDNIVSQIYHLIQLVNSVGGHENFLQTFRDVEKKIFHHAKSEILHQTRCDRQDGFYHLRHFRPCKTIKIP